MSDSYQAIYDAVRSRISNGDIGAAIEHVAWRAFDISHTRALLQEQFYVAATEMQRPSAIYRPELAADGDQWCALYGKDLQVGVAGFGPTPDAAMQAFDQAWWKQQTPAAIRLANAPQTPTPADAARSASPRQVAGESSRDEQINPTEPPNGK